MVHTESSERVRAAAGEQLRIKWGASGLGLADLGVESLQRLFEPTVLERLEVLERSPGRARWRFALPGTPDSRGNLTGRPGPLGTGWVWLTVFRGGFGELLRARCTQPRSGSLAEREWNLLCRLRAQGVGTPEPLLVAARGSGFVSGRSVLVVRAPEDAFPLERWLRTDGIGAERERGLAALGKSLGLLVRSGVELPELAARDVWMAPSGSGECETEAVGLRKNRAPGVTIVAVRGGRLGKWGDAAAKLDSVLKGVEMTDEERRRVVEVAVE